MGAFLKRFSRQLLACCCLLATAAPALAASEILTAAEDLKPGEDGLPPPLEKPLHVTVCFFDFQGKNGDFYSQAKDLALIAQRWNVYADLKVFTDERVTAENFKVGQCDAAGISTLRARQFNPFMGSIDSVGGVPDYASMRMLLHTLLDPKIAPMTITGPYQILGVMPIGGAYVHVNNRHIDSIEKAAGKKIAVLDWDKTQTEIVRRIGAQPVSADLTNIGGKFNNGQVDIIVMPALAYRPFELYRGLGEYGGIYKFPLAQMTASLVINRDRIKKKLPDLDDKLSTFRGIAGQFMDQMLDQIFKMLEKTEKDIPAKYWLPLEKANEDGFNQMMREARIQMTKEGYYDPKMMKLLKKVRCKQNPTEAECSLNDE
jgi:TRAP-type C4-dicarboxylate transport system substrate-binding protein